MQKKLVTNLKLLKKLEKKEFILLEHDESKWVNRGIRTLIPIYCLEYYASAFKYKDKFFIISYRKKHFYPYVYELIKS